MADLATYKAELRDNPTAVNDGKWYARGTVQHNGVNYAAGKQLPNDGEHALTNGQVADLLDVNALTSVAPTAAEGSDVQAPNQTGAVAPNAGGQAGPGSGNTDPNDPNALPEGAVGRDENGVAIDANGNPVGE